MFSPSSRPPTFEATVLLIPWQRGRIIFFERVSLKGGSHFKRELTKMKDSHADLELARVSEMKAAGIWYKMSSANSHHVTPPHYRYLLSWRKTPFPGVSSFLSIIWSRNVFCWRYRCNWIWYLIAITVWVQHLKDISQFISIPWRQKLLVRNFDGDHLYRNILRRFNFVIERP